MSISTSTLGSAIQAYRQSILAAAATAKPAGGDGSAAAAPIKAGPSATGASSAGPVVSAAATAKNEQVRQELEGLQTGIARDLRSALQAAGLSLTGTVAFKVAADGSLNLSGSASDKANITQVLNANTRAPTLASRIQQLNQKVDACDAANTRTAAMSSAARYAGAGQSGNVLALYQTLISQNSGASAVFAVSAQASQLAFSGAVNAKA
jgi:hypothetical protein